MLSVCPVPERPCVQFLQKHVPPALLFKLSVPYFMPSPTCVHTLSESFCNLCSLLPALATVVYDIAAPSAFKPQPPCKPQPQYLPHRVRHLSMAHFIQRQLLSSNTEVLYTYISSSHMHLRLRPQSRQVSVFQRVLALRCPRRLPMSQSLARCDSRASR